MIASFILPVVSTVKHFSTAGSTPFPATRYSASMANEVLWWKKAQAIRREKKRMGRPMRYADIAAAIGVKPERLGHWFVGRRPAPVPEVQKIADYLGVNIADFFVPNDGMVVTDPQLINAIKLMSQLQDNQKSLPLPKHDMDIKRRRKQSPKRAA